MRNPSRKLCTTFGALALAAVIAGCTTEPTSETKREDLVDNAQSTLRTYQREDPGMSSFLDSAYGYAVFPNVGKGGLIAGGAYGKGVVYQQGRMIGYCDLTQATIGAQIGGQAYSEIIAFEDRATLEKFKNNQLAFSAQASAVALKSGASANAKYENGVAVFTHTNGGLMAEASVGGQKFTYRSNRD
jgi:lipid-binding SYLF domain-containing protein